LAIGFLTAHPIKSVKSEESSPTVAVLAEAAAAAAIEVISEVINCWRSKESSGEFKSAANSATAVERRFREEGLESRQHLNDSVDDTEGEVCLELVW
jgi:hypothetical protein